MKPSICYQEMNPIGTQNFTMVKLAIAFVYSFRAASRVDICEVTEMSTRYHSVPQIRPPPFCNLSLSTKCRGGLYTGCDDFSHDYAPLLVPIKHDLIVGGG